MLPEDGVPCDIQCVDTEVDAAENSDLLVTEAMINEYDTGPYVYNDPAMFTDPSTSNDIYQAFVESTIDQALETDKIRAKINWPTSNGEPINEFEYEGLCSLAFPQLFPDGVGDPTIRARLYNVTETNGFRHLLKFATKNSKGELYYPFASHPRFKFWCYDRLRRHRSIDQCNVYLKKNPDANEITIAELKQMADNVQIDSFMKRMSAYSANITGSDMYWYHRRMELEATFEQKQSATVFFTFSYADNHWHELHRLMPGKYLIINFSIHLKLMQ